MKKLAALLIAAALISPVFAEEAKKPEAVKVEKKADESEAMLRSILGEVRDDELGVDDALGRIVLVHVAELA